IAPLLLFVVIGLFLFPRFNRRYPNLFTQSLIISSLPQVAVQLHMSFGSRVLFDSDFNIAHFLKILAYLIPFIGLCLTYIQIHREKENIVQKLMAAEQDLKQKQEQLKQTVRELKNTQSQLVQSEKMSSLGQLVAGVAHEINNPVNFIYGNFTHAEKYINEIRQIFDLYRYYYPNPHPKIQEEMDEVELDYLLEDFNRILKSMRLGSERIRNIVLSLRNFSRLDEADAKEIDIHEGIESTLLILGNQLKAKSDRPAIEIVKNYSEFPVIDCYPSQLNQVFMNILTNAIDALTQKCKQQPDFQPQISIATEFRESQCNIKIQDNGPGIPEEIQSKIFDPFFTTKSIGQGTGLGLSISYKIVTEKHQGQLVCSSSAETGTLFEIIIPQHLSGKE
ncbi:MAG: sensor histidine kinase, partial [Spirulina sp.]